MFAAKGTSRHNGYMFADGKAIDTNKIEIDAMILLLLLSSS